MGAVALLVTSAWYQPCVSAGGAMGLSPVEDQQLGGLVMWVPGATAYLIAGLVLVARLLARPTPIRATAARPVPTR